MDIFSNLVAGFGVALTPINLIFCAVGVLLGTFVGIMPGLGPSATVAMLLPLTFGREPTAGVILLAGIYYGAKYGGSITSILVNLPGESSSVVTCLDGYQLAKKGKGGTTIGIAAIGGFFGGTFSVLGLTFMAPPLAAFALSFGPPEYFALMLMGLTAVTFLAGKSMIKALLMGIFGLMLAVAGTDEVSGMERFTYDQIELLSGLDFPVVAIGLFAISEILLNVEKTLRIEITGSLRGWKSAIPTFAEFRQVLPTYCRAAIIGFFIGVLPGAGATISSFLSYAVEKGVSKHPEKFGTGVLEGVAGPETADNASTGGAMVPLFTLGIPGSGTTAILLAALMMLGLKPGPLLMAEHPDFFWGVVASMYIGNLLLLIINVPLAPIMATFLRLPYQFIYTTVLAVCITGVYSLNNSLWDVWTACVFGILGYVLKKLDYPAAPAVLGLVLGPMLERALRQTLVLSRGDYTVFFSRPISAVLMAICILLFVVPLVKTTIAWNAARTITSKPA